MAKPSTTPQLNDRAKHLLKTLINCYVSEGQPVGSKKLADASGLNISTATIRNVMASLDQLGLVVSPHTSAGRIPTEQGFRLFVDSMLEVSPLETALHKQLREQLDPDQDRESLIDTASTLLSRMTRMAGIISIPKSGQTALRQIEFLSLPDRRILAILVLNEREVQNRVLHVDRDFSQDELTPIANYINQHFMGHDIFEVRRRLLEEMHQARTQVDSMMKAAVELADQALNVKQGDSEPYVLHGKSNLIRFDELDNAQKLQKLFAMFESRRDMLSLLDRCIQAEDIQVFIGREAGLDVLGDCSVITAPYTAGGETLGVLGVIGPTRMQYDKVISIVDVTARLLGSALTPRR
jgi:heat-inducible transcriptional repressor